MNFEYTNGSLVCDGIALAEIADSAGTPVYVYSAAAIAQAYSALDAAFGAYPHRLHYALKANSTLAVARLLQKLGSGADANSVGEIEVALRAGFQPGDIVFSGVAKRNDELDRAVELGVQAINVESAGEVKRLAALARARGQRARVAVRVNPDVDAGSHPYISTGLRTAKFGVPIGQAPLLCSEIAASSVLSLVGLHVHVGSQILEPGPLARAAAAVVALASSLQDGGVSIEHLDIGGGVGIAYDGGQAMSAREYASAVLDVVAASGFPLLIEPGRVIVAPAGVLLTRVVDVKCRPGGSLFAAVDAGMTELIRPALYGAYHRIEPVTPRDGALREYEVVGPLCETSDTYGKPRLLPPLETSDLLAIRDAGGYGSVMASNYNRRPLAPEVLVEDRAWRVIRRRQTIDDMLALET
jgi:diaminopimelate decarboxylase